MKVKGMERLDKQLDIVYFMRKIITMDTLLKTLTTKYQRSMARRHHKLVLGEEKESSQSSDSDVSVDKVG